MRALRVHIHNLFSHEDTIVDLSNVKTMSVLGGNGSGKSTTFIDGPLWGLTGWTDRGKNHEIVRIGTGGGFVEFDWIDRYDRKWRVRRELTLTTSGVATCTAELSEWKSPELHAQSGWVPTEHRRVRDINGMIIDILGTNHEGLLHSAIIKEEKAGALTEMDPADRMAIVRSFFRIEEFAKWRKLASQYVQNIETKIAAIAVKVEYAGQAIVTGDEAKGKTFEHETELSAAQGAVKLLTAQKEDALKRVALLDEIGAQVRAATANVASAQEKKTRIEAIMGESDCDGAAQSLLASKQALVNERDLLRKKISGMADGIASAESGLEEKRTFQREAAGKYLTLTADKRAAEQSIAFENEWSDYGRQIQDGFCTSDGKESCPVRKRAFDAKGLSDEATAKVAAIEAECQKAKAAAELLDAEVQGAKDYLARIRKEKDAAAALERTAQGKIDGISRQETELATYMEVCAKLSDASHELKSLNEKLAQAEDSRLTLDLRTKELEAAQRQEREATTALAQLSVIIEQGESAKEALGQFTAERQSLWDEQVTYSTLFDAYKAIPARIIAEELPAWESAANHILQTLKTGIRVKLDICNEGRSKDTLEIRAFDGSGERAFSLWSSGQKFKLNFALRLALAQRVSRMEGALGRTTFIIDGNLGTQDEESREFIADCIEEMSKSAGLIIVISHFRDFCERFPVICFVKRENGISSLEMVGVEEAGGVAGP